MVSFSGFFLITYIMWKFTCCVCATCVMFPAGIVANPASVDLSCPECKRTGRTIKSKAGHDVVPMLTNYGLCKEHKMYFFVNKQHPNGHCPKCPSKQKLEKLVVKVTAPKWKSTCKCGAVYRVNHELLSDPESHERDGVFDCTDCKEKFITYDKCEKHGFFWTNTSKTCHKCK